jgi:hypothetical protein
LAYKSRYGSPTSWLVNDLRKFSMASYFRSLFGSSNNRKKSGTGDKSRTRSTSVASALPAQTLSHVYTEPGTIPPIAIPNLREQSNSNVAAHAITPSPLRRTAYDPGAPPQEPKKDSSSSGQKKQSIYGFYSRHRRGSSDSAAHYAQPSLYQQVPVRPAVVHRTTSQKAPERRMW